MTIELATSMKLYSDAALAKILDKEIFQLTGGVADQMGVECYIVGGFVRDIFLEFENKQLGNGVGCATS